jgi:diadenosine tetraphosphatase ApaH/serine/threonine PP2A family protein phosphatase
MVRLPGTGDRCPCEGAALRNSYDAVGRTLIIGDVHGCLDELDQLLDAAAISSNDRIVFVGDLIGRGPNSIGVLDRVAELQAHCVQGNHERQLLQLVDNDRDLAGSGVVHESRWRLVELLEPRHVQVLRAMPLYLELAQHNACVVHAGVVPGLSWADQDPWALTHMRSLDAQGCPSAELGKESWALAMVGPVHVVFGHNARRGLQLLEFATGLDSGCVYGGSLTGLLLQEGEPVPPVSTRRAALVSVPAHAAHFDVH